MDYREKTLIRGESLLIKVKLYTQNATTGKMELYNAGELTSILESTESGSLPKMIAEARLSDGSRIPLTIIQELSDGVAQDGMLTLFSSADTWKFPGESFDINIALKQRVDLGLKDSNGYVKYKDITSATFNETFYIAGSATDLGENGRLADA